MDNSTNEVNRRTPLHDLKSEMALLGGLLLDWNAMADVVSILKPDRFYSKQNQLIYSALCSLYTKGITADDITLVDELRKQGNLENAGGPAYIASLTQEVPSASNIEYYARAIVESSTRRELVKLTSEIREEATNTTGKETSLLLDMAEQKIFSLSELNETAKIHQMQDVVIEDIDLIEARYRNSNQFTGVPSGFGVLDTMTSGFQKSEFIIIGARPSIGKTALALSMMQEIALVRNIECGFFSLEMPYQSIGMRLLSMNSKVSMSSIRSGMLKNTDFIQLQEAAGRWYKAPLYTVDTPNMRLLDLRAMARRMVINHKVKIIFIDYIGLISTENPGAPVYEQVSEISKSLKALARELEIPIVALSQVSRDAEGKEPNLAQLRGSGAIEQDADVVMFIDRERPKDNSGKPQEAKIILSKQRNGPTGTIDIMFFPTLSLFANKSRE